MASLITPPGILSFPALFTPKPRARDREPDFNCSVLFDKSAQATEQYKDLQKSVLAKIEEKFGPGKSRDKRFMDKCKLPFLPCEEKEYGGYDIPGGTYIKPWSKSRPGIVDAQRNEILAPEDVWPGQLVRVSVVPFHYSNSGNYGISFALNNVQILKSKGMVRLDGRKPASADFEAWEDDSTEDDDDDSPF